MAPKGAKEGAKKASAPAAEPAAKRPRDEVEREHVRWGKRRAEQEEEFNERSKCLDEREAAQCRDKLPCRDKLAFRMCYGPENLMPEKLRRRVQ